MDNQFLFAGVALFMFSACATDEVLDIQEGSIIQFSNAFIDKATRAYDDPSFSGVVGQAGKEANLLSNFVVYGSVSNGDKEATLFDGVVVSNNDGKGWSYTSGGPRYWVPGNTYNFKAIAPASVVNSVTNNDKGWFVPLSDNVLPELLTYDATTQVDLLYATNKTSLIDDQSQQPLPAPDKAIEFSFKHMLSLVYFTFSNNIPNSQIEVLNITIKQAYQTATLNLSEQIAWVQNSAAQRTDNQGPVSFGHVGNPERIQSDNNQADATIAKLIANTNISYTSQHARLMIPETRAFDVTFTVNLYDASGEVLLGTYNKKSIAELTLVPNKKYNLKAELKNNNLTGTDLQPILFSAVIDEWDTPDGQDADEAYVGNIENEQSTQPE